MFPDKLDAIGRFNAAGDDSEVTPTVCNVIAEDFVTGEKVAVEISIAEV